MNFKLYSGKGRHVPKCKTCNKLLVKGELACEHRGYWYCTKHGRAIIEQRVEKLEAKISGVKQL
jgi:hypothetical protein